MLKITFENESLKVEGHAFYSKSGSDIVCAAISGIVLGGVNWFNFTDVEIHFEIRSNLFFLKIKNLIKENLIALQVIKTQIRAIAQNYPNYIKIFEQK